MTGSRWQHLDLKKQSAAPSRPSPAAEAPEGGAPDPGAERALHPLLAGARGYYQLHCYQACVDAVEALLQASPGPHLPGAQRLLGMALGQLGDAPAAAAALARAAEEAPDDPGLRASLLSARIAAGIRADPGPEPGALWAGALAELAGAASWLEGQRLLDAGSPSAAARSFAAAGDLFRASPPERRTERLGAAYLGRAVGHLLAGECEGAAQAYSRTFGRTAASDAILRLARQLYEVADEARGLDAAERDAAAAPLAELVRNVRVYVGFYDGVRAVVIEWEGLPF